ncbi:flagellar basal-body rod protein FlgF [Zavarzinia sp. CC-PAN008]|uniref:flagellar basal-body rod protein FlgF n=1 Tax=Zavarzinia sp. CC-PAN008 TaxID=3243332 RepID=UPI003F7465A5
MQNTLYVGLSNQMALRRQLDVVANNIANMNTTGFKGEQSVFQEYLEDVNSPFGDAAFVTDIGTARDTAEGEFQPTGGPLDFAINGSGYFVVQTAEGDRYTRDGHLTIDATGRLVTRGGDPVLDATGQPITLDPRGGPITVAADGSISVGANPVGRLQVVRFQNEQALLLRGGSLLEAPEGVVPEVTRDVRIAQGMIEGSNVNPVVEMTRMIEISRSYESVTRLMQDQAELQRSSVERLGRVTTA